MHMHCGSFAFRKNNLIHRTNIKCYGIKMMSKINVLYGNFFRNFNSCLCKINNSLHTAINQIVGCALSPFWRRGDNAYFKTELIHTVFKLPCCRLLQVRKRSHLSYKDHSQKLHEWKNHAEQIPYDAKEHDRGCQLRQERNPRPYQRLGTV